MESIRKRYSCRNYQDKAIEPEKLTTIFEAARLAPSAKNLQDWRFVVVTNKEGKRRLAEAANNQRFLEKAGAIVVACSVNDHVMRCGQPVGPIDVAIGLEHIALQSAAVGLGSCWIGSFYPDEVREVLGIPEDVAVIELMGIGYPADEPKGHKREPIEKIICSEKWQF